jgi:asparagine synthase (glutamine-hydrolysing)
MCGIAGFLQSQPGNEPELLRQVTAMADAIVHRGPDDGGAWADAAAGLAMASRRLAVVDLTQAGAQPMCSRSGRFVISYNGEIYNAAEIRPELEAKGISFRGHSDTEVLLEACAACGVSAAVNRFIGMFAFALWDRQARTLFLVRDRLGKKPLYWGRIGGLLLYGSELKALSRHANWNPAIDRDAVAAFLRFGYVPAPHSIYRGIQKLPPGTILEIGPRTEKLETYWTLSEQVLNGQKHPLRLNDEDAEQALAQLLDDAVGRRMIADVPLGAFLSGGIDSSTVVSLMQARSTRPVRTFSVGFTEPEYDEAPHARAVARHLGTDHTELYVSPDQARDVIPRLPEIYDEPFADSSQIPTYLVSALARSHVTVALSGDGGDELFCGYDRYARAQKIRALLRLAPRSLRALGARAIRGVPLAAWDGVFSLVPSHWRLERAGDRMHKLADLLPGDEDIIYRGLVSQWQDPSELSRRGAAPPRRVGSDAVRTLVPDYGARMQYLDALTYLPDDILVKLDRASMAVSPKRAFP